MLPVFVAVLVTKSLFVPFGLGAEDGNGTGPENKSMAFFSDD